MNEKESESDMVTIGAFLNGKLVCSITVPNKERNIDSAKRCLSDSYPEAKLYRKL